MDCRGLWAAVGASTLLQLSSSMQSDPPSDLGQRILNGGGLRKSQLSAPNEGRKVLIWILGTITKYRLWETADRIDAVGISVKAELRNRQLLRDLDRN